MARKIFHMFMLVVAFQLSWNVITSYCMHETGKAANHLGHHQHESTVDELAAAAKDKPDSSKKVSVHDAHCVSCAHIALAAPDMTELPFGATDAEHLLVRTVTAPASAFSSPPERPQWAGRA